MRNQRGWGTVLLLAGLAWASCGPVNLPNPPPPDAGDGALSMDGSPTDGRPSTDAFCPVLCENVNCGTYACDRQCLPGSGCFTCTNVICGQGRCRFGTGCFCSGALCGGPSGCPRGTGCI